MMTHEEYEKLMFDWMKRTPISMVETDPDPDLDTPLAEADDPTKLRRLADWFDGRESGSEDGTEVQDDLRRMARRFEEFVAPTAELERVLRYLTEHIIEEHTKDPWDMSDEETEVLEVITGWLSER